MELSWMDARSVGSLLISIYNLTRRWSFLWPRILRNPLFAEFSRGIEASMSIINAFDLRFLDSPCAHPFVRIFISRESHHGWIYNTYKGMYRWSRPTTVIDESCCSSSRSTIFSFSNHPCDPLFHELVVPPFPFAVVEASTFPLRPF